jgi:hypothetical protein
MREGFLLLGENTLSELRDDWVKSHCVSLRPLGRRWQYLLLLKRGIFEIMLEY